MIIRPAQPADGKSVVELVTRILSEEFPSARGAFETDDLQNLFQTYRSPASTFLVAQEGNRLVGTCGVKAESFKRAILRRLFVEKGCRGKGIGSSLLKEALQFCRERGYREIVIRTSAQMEQAIRLCRSLGFQEDGRWKLGPATLVRFLLKLT